MGTSYEQPDEGYTFGKLSPPPRDLLPIYPPQEPLELPALPRPLRARASFDAPYRLSTHLVPAAYLRTAWNAPLPDVRSVGGGGGGVGTEAKEERVKTMEAVYEAICDNCVHAGAGTDGHPSVLWNCVNRYVREGVRDGVVGATLFLAHATGFPKEVSWLDRSAT